MKSKLIKMISMVAMAATLFAVSTGFTASDMSAPRSCACVRRTGNVHAGTMGCTTSPWSEKYEVDRYCGRLAWYVVYERSRTKTFYCINCGETTYTITERQQRSYGCNLIPMESWYDV